MVACDPEELTDAQVVDLWRGLEAPVVLIARAAPPGHPLAALAGAERPPAPVEGREIVWHGPGPATRRRTREPLETALELVAPDCEVWATLDGAPLVAARRVGAGLVVTLGFHPSRARDADGAATALLRDVLVRAAPAPVAWLDLERTLVLRMDDPGGAQNVHASDWLYPKLGEREWAAVARRASPPRGPPLGRVHARLGRRRRPLPRPPPSSTAGPRAASRGRCGTRRASGTRAPAARATTPPSSGGSPPSATPGSATSSSTATPTSIPTPRRG